MISVTDIGIELYKHDPIEVKAERLMMEHTPGTTQPTARISWRPLLDSAYARTEAPHLPTQEALHRCGERNRVEKASPCLY
jgi:hypothetical protein